MNQNAARKLTLSFLPGTMCDERLWRPVWTELGERFGIAYLPIEKQLTGEGIRRVIVEAGKAAPLHLVAFSMGGYFALEHALAHPDQVASLVVICSSAFGLTEAEKVERGKILDFLTAQPYRGMSTTRLNQFVHPSHRSDPAVTEIMRAMDRELGHDVLVAQMKETSARVSLEPRLGEIACPVLLVGADSDPFVLEAVLQRMLRLLHHGRLALAREAGHMIPLEQPGWLADQITRFHAELADSPDSGAPKSS
jgi:pimeloyl-ACP methyl ester carboxylesterase